MAEPVLANATGNFTTNTVDTVSEELHLSLKTAFEHSGNSLLAHIASNQWLMFAAIVIGGFLASYLLVFFCKTVIRWFTQRTETTLDDELLEHLQHPVAISIFLLTLSVALVPLSLSNTLARILNLLLISGNVFLVGMIVRRTLAILIEHYGKEVAAKTESQVDDHILPIVRKFVTVVIYVITFLFILSVWGINIAPLLAGAGIAGIALAFSMQESLKHLFGGVSLAFDGAYAVGDRIKLSDGTVGVVYDISLRSTKIRLFTGDLMVVPNGKIANENFTTYAQPTMETAVVIPFSIAYGSDVEKCKKVVREALKGVPNMVDDPKRDDRKYSVDFLEMGPYSLNMRVLFWVDDYTKSWDAKLEANKRIYDTLVKHKFDIPFPTQTVYMKK